MSIFASQTQSDPIPIPFDPPHTVTVRKLTGREIEAAQRGHATSVAEGDARTWSARFRRILEGSVSDRVAIEQAITDPLTGFDRFALLVGVVAWSYPHPLRHKPGRTVPATTAAAQPPAIDPIDDLDDEAVDFFATEVLRRTKPALFLATPADADAEKKSA